MKVIPQIVEYSEEASEFVKDMTFHDLEKDPSDLPASGIPCLCDVTIAGERQITTLHWTVMSEDWSRDDVTVHRWAYKKLKHPLKTH